MEPLAAMDRCCLGESLVAMVTLRVAAAVGAGEETKGGIMLMLLLSLCLSILTNRRRQMRLEETRHRRTR
jgi:hypothetical protein